MTTALERLTTGYYNSNRKSPATPGGMAGNGHQVNLPAALADVAAVIGGDLSGMVEMVTAAVIAAQTAAASALGSPTSRATSTSNIVLETGTKVWNIGAGHFFSEAQTIVSADANNRANFAIGRVDSYAGGLLTVVVSEVQGPDVGVAKANWIIALTATGGVPISRKVLGAGMVTQSGTGALSGDVTLTVPAASVAQMLAATSTTVAASPKVFADMAVPLVLADAPTVVWNAGQRINAYLEMKADRTIAKPTTLVDGWTYGYILQQDSVGGRRPFWAPDFDLGSEGRPTPPPAAGAFWVGFFTYFAITGKLHLNGRGVV